MAYSDNVSIIRKYFEGHRVDIFARFVLGKLQLDQIRVLEWAPVHWISIMSNEPSDDVFMIKYETVGGADRSLERLEAEGAEGKGQALESGMGTVALLDA
jgi:hypothetical protein